LPQPHRIPIMIVNDQHTMVTYHRIIAEMIAHALLPCACAPYQLKPICTDQRILLLHTNVCTDGQDSHCWPIL